MRRGLDADDAARSALDMRKSFAAVVLLSFVLSSCKEEAAKQPEVPVTPPAAGGAHAIAAAEVHDAICGHVLPDVKHCGNYVKLDDKWVEILWPSFGKMEWCKDGEKGAKIEITGEMKDGKFVAGSYRRVE